MEVCANVLACLVSFIQLFVKHQEKERYLQPRDTLLGSKYTKMRLPPSIWVYLEHRKRTLSGGCRPTETETVQMNTCEVTCRNKFAYSIFTFLPEKLC